MLVTVKSAFMVATGLWRHVCESLRSRISLNLFQVDARGNQPFPYIWKNFLLTKLAHLLNNFSLLVKLLDYFLYILLLKKISSLWEKKKKIVLNLKEEKCFQQVGPVVTHTLFPLCSCLTFSHKAQVRTRTEKRKESEINYYIFFGVMMILLNISSLFLILIFL